MQQPLFGDMNFRSNGMSEDCLYLNVWTPAKSANERLPVLVYFFGGGFLAGDGSEPRYDGESMARKGIVALTVNYRLGVFGFLAHPELTKESPHHSSGNYTLLDQHAALLWVRDNIAAFGGDPRKVTIAGESAGSIAVSAQMASPLSRDLIAGAIGESGSIIGALAPVPLAQAEEQGVKFAAAQGAKGIAELRAMPAAQLLEAAGKPGTPRFTADDRWLVFPGIAARHLRRGQAGPCPAAGRMELRGIERARRAGPRRADQGEFRKGGDAALRRGREGGAGRVRSGNGRGGSAGGHRSGERPLHRVQHVEVDRLPARRPAASRYIDTTTRARGRR